MKKGLRFNILWQSAGWSNLMGNQDDGKSQDRFLGLIKDCKSSGSSLQRLPVLKGNTWMAEKKHSTVLLKNQQHFWVTNSYWLISSWQSNSIASEAREHQSSLHKSLKQRNGKMTQKHCLLHSVQCWAQLKCYCRKLLHLCFCFHLSIYLWVESAFRGGPVTPVVSCMFFIIIQADLLGFNMCGSLYQAPGNKC